MRRLLRGLGVPVLALACAGLAATACTKKIPRQGELRARVLPAAPGAAVTDEDTRIAAGVVDLAIGELGIQRREVAPLPGGKIRIVLPESLASRVPDVRKRLEDPKLRVQVE